MSKAVVHFRHSSALTLAAVITMIAMLSLAAWAPYLLVLLVVPLAVALWSWRTGTDADETGLTVSAALGRKHIPWGDIDGFVRAPHGRVAARLISGTAIELPAVRFTDVPRLVAVSGTELVTDPR